MVTPLQPSVVYSAEDPDALDAQYEGVTKGYTYAREGHPNAEVLAGLIDGMEKASGGVVVGSGMAAVTVALLGVLKAGDHAVGADQLYGRSPTRHGDQHPVYWNCSDPFFQLAHSVGIQNQIGQGTGQCAADRRVRGGPGQSAGHGVDDAGDVLDDLELTLQPFPIRRHHGLSRIYR